MASWSLILAALVVGITICVAIGYIVFLQPNPDTNVPDLPPSDAVVETPPDETSWLQREALALTSGSSAVSATGYRIGRDQSAAFQFSLPYKYRRRSAAAVSVPRLRLKGETKRPSLSIRYTMAV